MSDLNEAPDIIFNAPEPDELTAFFPGYEIDSLIAQGGMGAVYCAVQKSLERTVALKILPREFSQDAAYCEAFKAEAKAMARLNHPNLIGVYDFGEVNGMLYIIMEYVPGKSLFHSAHGLAIDPGEVIRLVSGICQGLAHAHAHGIIHRDIKPSNILLDLKAQPKIGDFGLARPIGQKTEEGANIFGTPHYTAPEVCSSPNSVNYRADIFSVGVLLHELLTSRLPAEDPRPASVIVRCDPRFDAIIRRATDPVPELRYASADEIARDLKAILSKASGGGGKQVTVAIPGRVVAAGPAGPARQAAAVRPPRAKAARSKSVIYQKESSLPPALVMVAAVLAIGGLTYYCSRTPPAPKIVAIDPVPAPPPEPEPAPPPEPEPEPEPEPAPPPIVEPETPPEPQPEPEPVSEVPKFDVADFLAKAQKVMQDRAVPIIAKNQADIKSNFWTFEITVLRNADGPQSRAQIKRQFDELNAKGSRIPPKLSPLFAQFTGVPEFHAESLEKQKNLDFALRRDVGELAPTYLLGLRKQIERLKTENDPAAIALIEAEIERTREDAEYFTNLMLGIDPDEEPPAGDDSSPPVDE